jgi:hypothetical protein
MAKESVGYLPGSDPDAIKANMEYQTALQRMQDALFARQNRMFDPQMLALASGFLAPTQTGGFGESLGMAAKNLRAAQQEEEKEERDIAAAQLGLAGKGIELERMRQRDRAFGSLMGQPTTTLSTSDRQPSGALPSGEPSGALSRGEPSRGALPAPAGFENVPGIQTMPPNPRFMSGSQYISMARLDPSISPTAAMKEAQKMEQDRLQVKEGGVQDLASGIFYPFPKGETVKRQIFGREGTFDVDTRTAALLDMYAANGDPRYYEVAERIIKGPKAPPKPGEEPKETEGRETVEAREAREAGMKTTAQERAKAQEDERKKVIEAGSKSRQAITTYNNIEKLVSGPEAALLTGILERPGVLAQVGKLVETGLGTPGFTIGIPAVREILTNAGLPQDLIDKSQTLVSLLANVQLQISRLAEGQGQVSDFERSLFGQAGLTIRDNPQAILAKIKMLRTEAEFSQKVARGLRKFKGNIDEFRDTEEYQRYEDEYKEKAQSIFDGMFGSKPTSKAPAGRDNRGAASRLPEGL